MKDKFKDLNYQFSEMINPCKSVEAKRERMYSSESEEFSRKMSELNPSDFVVEFPKFEGVIQEFYNESTVDRICKKLKELEGVESAVAISAGDDVTFTVEGGDNKEIAKVIYEGLPLLAITVGDTNINYFDESTGMIFPVSFNKVKDSSQYFPFTYDRTTGEILSSAKPTIKNGDLVNLDIKIENPTISERVDRLSIGAGAKAQLKEDLRRLSFQVFSSLKPVNDLLETMKEFEIIHCFMPENESENAVIRIRKEYESVELLASDGGHISDFIDDLLDELENEL